MSTDVSRRQVLAAGAALAGTAALIAGPAATASAATASNVTAQEEPRAKPTIVLVHGGYADSSCWNATVQRLQHKGHGVICGSNPLRGIPTDAPYIASLLDSISGPVPYTKADGTTGTDLYLGKNGRAGRPSPPTCPSPPSRSCGPRSGRSTPTPSPTRPRPRPGRRSRREGWSPGSACSASPGSPRWSPSCPGPPTCAYATSSRSSAIPRWCWPWR